MGSMHASIFARLRGCELAAMVDLNTTPAKSVACRFDDCAVYASHEEPLENERPDLLSICTPDNLRLGPALAAAAKGVTLFIEKPIASSLDEAEAIVAACEKAGTKLGIGYLSRFDPRRRRGACRIRQCAL